MAAKAELRGRLTLNDALFHTGLRRAEGAIKNFVTRPVAQLGGALTGLFTINAFKSGIEGAIELGDKLWKLNKATGINVGSLGALQEVSALTGIEMAQVAKGVGFMQRNLVNATKGGASESMFRLLKLDVQELIGLRPEEAFQRIGLAINDLPDPALKTAAAMKIFGKAGRDLLPFFSEIGEANFGNLSDRSRLLQENAAKFHQVTVEMRKAEMNLKTGFISLASELTPTLLKFSEMFKKMDFSSIGAQWGESLVNGIADVFSGHLADRITAALKDKIADALGKVPGLSGLADSYRKDAEALRKGVDEARQATGIVPGGGAMAQAAPVSVQGYSSPLDNGQRFSGDTRGLLKWKSELPSMGKSFRNFGGPLSGGAFGQRGGLGSMAGWDTKAIMSLGTDELQNVLFSAAERSAIQNQIVAAGGSRSATSPYAYNAVSAGDTERRSAYLKQELKQKLGVDRSNELLEDIKTAVEDTADVWSQ